MSNWAEYERALVQRGDLTLWISTDVAGAWKPAGTLLDTWCSAEAVASAGPDGDIFFARSDDGGNSWSNHAMLASNAGTDSGNDLIPRAVGDGYGNWVVVWVSLADPGFIDNALYLLLQSPNSPPATTKSD